MRRSASTLLLALIIAAPAVTLAQAPAAAATPRPKPAQLPADSMERGRKYTQWLYTNQVDSLIAHMDSAGKAQPNVKAEYESRVAQLAERAGDEVKVLEEKFITRNGARQYWRTVQFTRAPENVIVRFVIGSKGEMLGIGLSLVSQAPPIDP